MYAVVSSRHTPTTAPSVLLAGLPLQGIKRIVSPTMHAASPMLTTSRRHKTVVPTTVPINGTVKVTLDPDPVDADVSHGGVATRHVPQYATMFVIRTSRVLSSAVRASDLDSRVTARVAVRRRGADVPRAVEGHRDAHAAQPLAAARGDGGHSRRRGGSRRG